MTGFGGFSYGGGPYGGIHIPAPPPAPTSLLVQPSTTFIGNPILVASTSGTITDTSRDDSFISGFDSLKWSETIVGTVDTSGANGLTIELHKNGASSLTLTSIDAYLSGDISLDYDLLSDYMSDQPVDEIVYVGLQMAFVGGNTFTIKRKIHPGFNGQSIQAEFLSDGNFAGGANVLTTQSSGSFRLIKHNNVIAAIHDGELVFSTTINATNNFSVKLFSTTNGQNGYLKARYKAYRSTTGILFGTSPLVDRTLSSTSRILGNIPYSSSIGLVDVQSFNHNGITGELVDGFEYPLILGQALSNNAGVNGHVQNDVSIR